MSDQLSFNARDLNKIEEIGKGGFGKVWRVSTNQGQILAAKYIERDKVKADFGTPGLSKLRNECEVMKRLQHPNVVRFIGWLEEGPLLILLSEFIDGRNIAKMGQLNEPTTKNYLRQICQGLSYLHSSGVIHRDIKGDNIMVTGDGTVKIIDFGISVQLVVSGKGTQYLEGNTQYGFGTPNFMAPELVSSSQFSPMTDIWALGMTVYQMMTGEVPFSRLPTSMVLEHIKSSGAPELKNGSNRMLNFYTCCTAWDPGQRSSAKQLLQHSLFSG